MLACTFLSSQVHALPAEGTPGYVSPFTYNSQDKDGNDQTDWTFIWFWLLVFMTIWITATISIAYATSDVLEEGYDEKIAEEKKKAEEAEKMGDDMMKDKDDEMMMGDGMMEPAKME